jgi:para-nitrobenzyl esterase
MMRSPRVVTTSGVVEGSHHDGYRKFLGIPYAAPPVGALRFVAPRPPTAWSGVREATSFSPHAPQPRNPFYFVDGQPIPTSEAECLTLNVWTPAPDAAKRPVMVWIHGGAFVSGGSSFPMTDGSRFATDHDIVLVSINYRLGILGFTYLGDIGGDEFRGSGSLGVQDAAAALEWVAQNIETFGGDPGNVTIFGESAGASLVAALLALPAARDRFHKALMQSGSSASIGPDEAARNTAVLLDLLGSPHADVGRLQQMPVQALLDAFDEWSGGANYRIARPVVDGEILPLDPLNAVAAGAARDVAILAGTNRDEWRLWTVGLDADFVSEDGSVLRAALGALPLKDLDRAIATYQRRLGDTRAVDVFAAAMTDSFFRIPTIRLADAQHESGGRSWQYLFTWPSPRREGELGSCHVLEIPFVFNSFEQHGAAFLTGRTPPLGLARDVNATWAAFARHGDPELGTLGDWPRYEPAQRRTKIIDVEVSVENDPLRDERLLWMSEADG